MKKLVCLVLNGAMVPGCLAGCSFNNTIRTALCPRAASGAFTSVVGALKYGYPCFYTAEKTSEEVSYGQ